MGWLTSQPTPPLIDVFICTYNEEEAILEQTIVGALAMDYPNYRLWTLDDGRRPWLEALCERLGCGYITRADNAHAKAGNINNALRRVAALDPPPDFVSILDADFVPTPNFLTRAMTLFHDDDVGVVQTPQHFANPDPMQRNLSVARVWPDEQRYFFDVIMASKDAWDAAFCCGTSSIIRFAPLMAIGGFPDRFGDRGLSADAAAQADRLSHRLSQRAAVARPRAGGPARIHRPAQPLVPRLHADLRRPQRAAAPRQRPQPRRSADPQRDLPALVGDPSAIACSASRCRSAISCSGLSRSAPTSPTRSIISCPSSSPRPKRWRGCRDRARCRSWATSASCSPPPASSRRCGRG